MADINLSTSIDAIKTRILDDASTATVEEISSYARAARAAGLDQDSAVETAINDRVTTLASTGTAEEVRKLSATINQIRNAPVTSSILNNTDQLSEGTENLYYTDARVDARISNISVPADISELTDTTGLLGSGSGVTTYTDMSVLIAATGMSTGDQAFVQSNNNLYIYNGTGWYKIATVENLSPTPITGVNSTYNLASDGTPTVITAVSTDPEGFPLTWSYQVTSGSLGTTATVSQSDNVFTITPGTNDPADIGTFELTFSATDGINIAGVSSTFSLDFPLPNSLSGFTTWAQSVADVTDPVTTNNPMSIWSTEGFTDGDYHWVYYTSCPSATGTMWGSPYTGLGFFTHDSLINRVLQHAVDSQTTHNTLISNSDPILLRLTRGSGNSTYTGITRNGYTSLSYTTYQLALATHCVWYNSSTGNAYYSTLSGTNSTQNGVTNVNDLYTAVPQ